MQSEVSEARIGETSLAFWPVVSRALHPAVVYCRCTDWSLYNWSALVNHATGVLGLSRTVVLRDALCGSLWKLHFVRGS